MREATRSPSRHSQVHDVGVVPTPLLCRGGSWQGCQLGAGPPEVTLIEGFVDPEADGSLLPIARPISCITELASTVSGIPKDDILHRDQLTQAVAELHRALVQA
jgi:hypothetical protein